MDIEEVERLTWFCPCHASLIGNETGREARPRRGRASRSALRNGTMLAGERYSTCHHLPTTTQSRRQNGARAVGLYPLAMLLGARWASQGGTRQRERGAAQMARLFEWQKMED